MQQNYTDTTLACEGKFYNVHKLVLSTCSDYFGDVLFNANCKNPVVILKDIKCGDLEALLDYMYLGEVNVRQSDLPTLIKAAECLKVKGLAVPDDDPVPVKSSKRQLPNSFPVKKKRKLDSQDEVTVSEDFSQDNNYSETVSPDRPAVSTTPHKLKPIVDFKKLQTNSSSNSSQKVMTEEIFIEDPIEQLPPVKIEKLDSPKNSAATDSNIVNLKEELDDVIREDDDNSTDNIEGLPEFLQSASGPIFTHSSFNPDVPYHPVS